MLDLCLNEDDKEGSYNGGCLPCGLEWSKSRDARRCLRPRCIHREAAGEIRCSTAELFQTDLKETKGKPCGLLVVEREKGTCPVECVKREAGRRKGEGKQKESLTLHATDLCRGLAIGELGEVMI